MVSLDIPLSLYLFIVRSLAALFDDRLTVLRYAASRSILISIKPQPLGGL
jgi:hypothetical protein